MDIEEVKEQLEDNIAQLKSAGSFFEMDRQKELLSFIILQNIRMELAEKPYVDGTNLYRAKFRAFCEGLEMREIDDIVDGSVEDSRKLGVLMASRIRSLI